MSLGVRGWGTLSNERFSRHRSAGRGDISYHCDVYRFVPRASEFATPQSPHAAKPPPLPKDVPQPDVLEELERLAEVGRIKAAEDGKNRRWLRPIGFFARLLAYAALFLLLYIWAPKDISNTPLGALTLSDIAGTIVFIAIGVVLVRALFTPSEDDGIRDAWGWFGVLLLCAVGLGTLYIYNMR